MKKFLFFLIAFVSLSAKSENVTQFTGGNYIYAENGRLIFNLETNLFKSRNWTYDAEKDAAVSDFAVNLPLKTKYTSEWYGYEAMNRSNYHYAAYNPYYNDNIQNIIRPVYMKKAFLPAVAWGIRIGGMVVRNVVPRIVTKCLSNWKCASAAATVFPVCGFSLLGSNMWEKFHLPKTFCQKAEKDGYKKNENGEYVKSVSYQLVSSSGLVVNKGIKSTYSSESAGIAAALADCKSIKKGPFNYDLKFESSKIIPGNNNVAVECRYSSKNASGSDMGPYSAGYHVKKIAATEQKLTMVDIENFVSDDFKDNPNDYINGIPGIKKNGDIEDGTGMLPAVEVTAARIEKKELGGSFSVIGSEPYRDPKTGQTLQDMLTISNAEKSNNAKPSGSVNSGSAAGTSTTYNNVSQTTISRPDKEADASIGKENNANGTNGSGSSGSGSGSGTGDGKDDEKGNCKPGDTSVQCAQLGDVQEGENPFGIGSKDISDSFAAENLLPSSGTCPSDRSFSYMGKTFSLSYSYFCQFAELIRYLVLAAAAVTAAYIVMGVRKGTT